MTTRNLTIEKTNPIRNSLAAKLIEVMRECGYVKKDAENKFHKYKYASASTVLEKVNEALCKHRVATFMETEIISESIEGKEKFITAKVTINLVDPDTGETMQISGIGSGQDSGDKAIAKAQTMALKYAWMMSLNISTGDDPEADESTDYKGQQRYIVASSVQRSTASRESEYRGNGNANAEGSSGQTADYWAGLYNKARNWDEFKSIKQSMGSTAFNRFSQEEKNIIMSAANNAKERFENAN